jgi:alpha-aminoadipate/glutamate carrier protein LysW
VSSSVSSSTCPECDGAVQLAQPTRLSEIIECPDCRSELEVIELEPVKLVLAPEVEEDWGE